MTAQHRGERKHHWRALMISVGEVGRVVMVPLRAAEPSETVLGLVVPLIGVDASAVLLVLVPTAYAARKVPKVAGSLVAAARDALNEGRVPVRPPGHRR